MSLASKSLAELVFGTKRGLSLVGAGALYGGGSYLMDRQKEYQRAYVGEREYQSRYARGDAAARTALTAGSLYVGLVGGVLGKNPITSVVRGAAKAAKSPYSLSKGIARGIGSRKVLSAVDSIGNYNEPFRNKVMSRFRNRAYNTSGFFGGRPKPMLRALGKKMMPKNPWTYAGIGTFGVGIAAGLSFTPSYRNAAEGKITALGKMSSGRMNYSTAGLTQALHRRR